MDPSSPHPEYYEWNQFLTVLLQPVMTVLMQIVFFSAILMCMAPSATAVLGPEVASFGQGLSYTMRWFSDRKADYLGVIFGVVFTLGTTWVAFMLPFVLVIAACTFGALLAFGVEMTSVNAFIAS